MGVRKIGDAVLLWLVGSSAVRKKDPSMVFPCWSFAVRLRRFRIGQEKQPNLKAAYLSQIGIVK